MTKVALGVSQNGSRLLLDLVPEGDMGSEDREFWMLSGMYETIAA
jgi:hypothetical protein